MIPSKDNLKTFFSNKFLLVVLSLGFILNLSNWLLFWLGLDLDKTALILHYNSFFGIDRISVNSEGRFFGEIFFAPLSSFLFLIINYFLGLVLIFTGWEKSDKNYDLKNMPTSILGGYFILLSGIILQIMILVYTISIVLVNR